MWLKNFKQCLHQHVENIGWLVWNRLGLHATGKACCYSVDIENSLLLGALACRTNARLFEGMMLWVRQYHTLINKERLSNLSKDLKDPFVTRFLGAVAENLKESTWSNFVSGCRKTAPKKNGEPLFLNIPLSKSNLHPVFSKWGLHVPHFEISEESMHKKLKNRAEIIRKNSGLAYRYWLGPVNRTDILYLFSISQALEHLKESDYLTSLRLEILLNLKASSVYRIRRDFENAGILKIGTAKKIVARQWTWRTDKNIFPFNSDPLEAGILNWTGAVKILSEFLSLSDELEKHSSPITLKSKLVEIQQKWFDWLAAHGLLAKGLPMELGPLEKYEVGHFEKWISKSFGYFIEELGKDGL